MATTTYPCSLDHRSLHPLPCTNKKDNSSRGRHTLNYLRRSPKMRSGSLETNNMNTGPHTVNIPRVHRIPQTRRVSHVRLRRHQKLERNIFRSQRIGKGLVGLVKRCDFGTELAGRFFDVLRCNVFWRCLFWDRVGCKVDKGSFCRGVLSRDGAEGGRVCVEAAPCLNCQFIAI